MIPRCCRVETLSGDLSRIGGESTKNTKNTKNKRGNHKKKTLKNKSNHTSTRLTITQDPQRYKNNKGKDTR